MYSARKASKRFTLLLLEEEEDYVQDWVVSCRWPATVSGAGWVGGRPVDGRIRLCTRSVFFDPDDISLPIARLPFAAVQTMAPGEPPATTINITCTAVTKMKANMKEVPYVFEKGKVSTWAFTFKYAPLTAFLPLAQQLLDAARMPKPERSQTLEAFVRAREDSLVFDTSRLADFSERILVDIPATQLTPLVRERGHLVITNTRLYFQPLHNVSGDTPVRSHPLAGIAAIARRRSCLRPLGVELFFVRPSDARAAAHRQDGGPALGPPGGRGSTSTLADLELVAGGQVWEGPSAFFVFRSESDREAVATQLAASPMLGAAVPHAAAQPAGPGGTVLAHSRLLEAQGGWLHRVTAAWQAARISNFDYLMYLNLAAGRSFNDLAQWPVFPWVLSNWTAAALDLDDPANYRDLSKPVGALNPSRLAEFKRRYRDMPHDSFDEGAIPPFLYGTHYSTPGYVMYWLLRAAPAHMLRLQNGRFDAPDRLFHDLAESWNSVLNSSTDVKELIPEFYLPGGGWLVNAQRLPLGERQNGHAVGDVQLPPWARDPEHFLAVHRAALEAPPVSAHLHAWIDLIFGYKQTGPAAEAADNVFYHLTYEGALDVSKVTDPIELKAYETQINEFGQTPRQLFSQPHPARAVIPPAPDPAAVFFSLTAAEASSNASSAPSASGWAVCGSETGYRALALALLSAIRQAADVEGEPLPPLSPPPALTAAHGAPKPPWPAVVPRSSLSGTVPSPEAESSFGEAGGGMRGAVQRSSSQLLGVAASAVSSAAGGVLSGLLKIGRYQSGSGAGLPWQDASAKSIQASGIALSAMDPALPGQLGHKAAAAFDDDDDDEFLDDLASILEPKPAALGDDAGSDAADGAAFGAGAPAAGASWSAKRARDGWGGPVAHALGSGQDVAAQVAAVCISRDAITGVATWSPDGHGAFVYAVTGSGLLRTLQVQPRSGGFSPQAGGLSITNFRSYQGESDFLCLAALHGWVGGSGGGGVPASGPAHPLLLAGSQNQRVYAYTVERGQVLGSFQAHDDGVSAIALPDARPSAGPALPARFFTSSWDCTIKAWELAQGTAPWEWASSSLAPRPLTSWDVGEGVWALAAGEEASRLVLGGTEEGLVVACDVRAPNPAWSVRMAQDYIGGLALTPCGRFVTVGAADGSLALLDVRRAGAGLAVARVEAPLRCCCSDGRLAMAGDEAGVVHLWDVGLMGAAHQEAVGARPPAPDGRYQPWLAGSLAADPAAAAQPAAAVTAVDARAHVSAGTGLGQGGACAALAVGREDGCVVAVLAPGQ